VNADVPKDPGGEGDLDPIEGAERAIEDLEAELLAEFMEKATRWYFPRCDGRRGDSGDEKGGLRGS
jgi:hypothetical protein